MAFSNQHMGGAGTPGQGQDQATASARNLVAQAMQEFREAPLTHEIACVSQQLGLHPDPADRFLAATAKVLNLTLVTEDARLLACPGINTLSNR